MLPPIEIGYPVFLADGAEAFGAVRAITLRDHRPSLVVNVEGAGDFRVELDAIDHIAAKKVVLRWDELGAEIQEAIRHALDQEDFPPRGEEVELVPEPPEVNSEEDDPDAFKFRE